MKILIALALFAFIDLAVSDVTKTPAINKTTTVNPTTNKTVTNKTTTKSTTNKTTIKTTTKAHKIKEPNRLSTTPLRSSSTTIQRNVGGESARSSSTPTPSTKPTAPTPTIRTTTGKNAATTKPTAPTPVTTTKPTAPTSVTTKVTTKKSVQAATTTIKSSVNTTAASNSNAATSTKLANSTASTAKPSNSTASTSKATNSTATSTTRVSNSTATTSKAANVTTTATKASSSTATSTKAGNSTTATTNTPVKNTVKTTTEETTTAEATTAEPTTVEGETTDPETPEESTEEGETTEGENSEETPAESSEESTEPSSEESSEESTEPSSEETPDESSEEEPTEEETTEVETTEAPPTTLKYPNNCICVPEGTCSVLGGNSTSNSTADGAGQLDPRIVNPATPTNQTTGTNSSIATVASTGVPIVAESQTNCAFWNPALDLCCPANGYQCGTVFPPMPGSASMPGRSQFGQFPWQGMIFTTNDVYVGTGVLIDQQNFLTVAYRVLRFPNSEFKVRMGEWDTSSQREPLDYKEYNVKMNYVHENYTASNLKNNIAILRLETNVPLGRYPTIATACLSSTDITGLRCFVSGWGRNDFSYGANQAVQRFVDVPIVNRTQCQATLKLTRLGKNFELDPGFMCAGGEPGKDACTGDGGAPLVCKVVSQWYVVGLVNWGIGCGTNIPGVYTDVNYYLPWIQSKANL